MAEEQDSRTATVGIKRAFDSTHYDLVTDSDSSNGEPVHKRPKQTSQSLPQSHLPSATGGQTEYISLLDSDDSDSEEYASAEPGEVLDLESAQYATASGPSNKSQHEIEGSASTETKTSQGQEASDEDEFASAEAGSIKEEISSVQGTADAPINTNDTAGSSLDSDGDSSSNRTDTKQTVWKKSQTAEKKAEENTGQQTSTTTGVKIVQNANTTDINRRIHFGRLPWGTTSDDVRMLFKDFKVESISMTPTRKTVFGFVCLSSAADATRAVATLNGKEVLGHAVKLSLTWSSNLPAGDTEDVKQPALTENHPAQLAVMGNHSDHGHGTRSVRKGTDLKQLGKFPYTKKGILYQERYGDECFKALEQATTKNSEYAVPIPDQRRLCKVSGHDVLLPEMVMNDSPISFSELSFATFIPLFIKANASCAPRFVTKPLQVVEAFNLCINLLYGHRTKKEKKNIFQTAHSSDMDFVYTQVAAGIASVNPKPLRNTIKMQSLGKDEPRIRKAVNNALEMFDSDDANKPEKPHSVLSSSISTPGQDSTIIANTKFPTKVDLVERKSVQGFAARLTRHISDLQESNLMQASTPGYDVHIHQTQLQSVTDEEDEELQKKYFPSSNLSTSGPRCLTCGKTDHRTSQCVPVVCNSCDRVETHFTWACPEKLRCQRCREQGHRSSDCPEKLNRSSDERIKCELCGSSHHIETACHELWRSYKPPLIVRKVAGLQINCFACGADTHFGVDCGLRPENQLRASFSFSMSQARKYIDPNSNDRSLSAGKDYSIKMDPKKKPRDFSIKGRAKNEPINLDSDSDTGDFLHPPIRKNNSGPGHIQINNRNASLDQYQNPPPSMSRNFSRDQMPQTYQPQYGRRERSPPAYRDFRDEDNRAYGRPDVRYGDNFNRYDDSTNHYEPQYRYYDGHPPAVDHYDGRSTTAPQIRVGGTSRGGGTLRGGSANGGGVSKKRKKAKRGGASYRPRGS